MLNIPANNASHSRTPSSNTFTNSREFKNIQIPQHTTNFLYDVIMPQTLNIQNIRIIKKHQKSNSPETILKKVVEMKKSKIQLKIQSIVKRNTEFLSNPVENVPKLKKYTKQDIKTISKFAQNDKYKQFLFEQQIPIQKMKLNSNRQVSSSDKENTFIKNSNLTANSNWVKDQQLELQNSPYFIEMNEKLGEMRKMQEEMFQPFKVKIRKVIDKTITAGKNGKANALMEKVNFYLTSISQAPSKNKYKKITVDVYQRDRKVKSYCEQIQKGEALKKNPRKSLTKNVNASQAKHYRSASKLMKTRPQTSVLPSQIGVDSRIRPLSTNARSLSSSRFNSYRISSAESNIKSKQSAIQHQKNCFSNLLEQIESTCWQSQIDAQILQKKMNKMSNQWNIDGDGFRVYQNKKMNMNMETLEMLKKLRLKCVQMQNVQKEVMNND